MYFFNDPLVEYAVEYFKQTDFADPACGDTFWRLFAPGNTLPLSDRPFERFCDYEEMLRLLQAADQARHQQMHKGTPFYFMSWLAFDLGNYEKALFYIDSAISEDVRKTKNTAESTAWKKAPGAAFLLLEPKFQVAKRAIESVRAALDREVTRFNGMSGKPPLDIQTIQQFVTRLIADPSQRTIISALYVFVMEFSDRVQELELRRGSEGGSNEPFTVHLFTGGLLLESLLKHYYPNNDNGDPNRVLGSVFRTATFQRDFALGAPPASSADTLNDIHRAIGSTSPIEDAFSTAAKLRNTTGHNLVWDDVFSDAQIYTDLFRQIMNALLYVVDAKGR
jgi:hypothetical protein